MGLISVTGQPGCRYEEVARIAANRLGFQLLTAVQICSGLEQEFAGAPIPDKAYPDAVASLLAHLATEQNLVVAASGVELLARSFPGMLRVGIVAPEAVRIGNLMVDRRLERAPARGVLRDLETNWKQERRRRFGRMQSPPELFDLVLNAEKLQSEQMADAVETTARAAGIIENGHLSQAAEVQLQFQLRLRLARHGMTPAGKLSMERQAFAHPSEEMFANLLDFYRIPWEYEPRSFPIHWHRDGKVLESFTPDFYLPEYDLYVELTTMKQSLVTRKNRKVKLLREIYPDVNIQVFYQKDFENLIFKYGLAHRLAPA